MHQINESNSFFWQYYFVEGSSAFLSETINGELALVNGSPVTIHNALASFSSKASKEEHDRIQELIYGLNPLEYGQSGGCHRASMLKWMKPLTKMS
jgi:hypothetical protein